MLLIRGHDFGGHGAYSSARSACELAEALGLRDEARAEFRPATETGARLGRPEMVIGPQHEVPNINKLAPAIRVFVVIAVVTTCAAICCIRGATCG